MPSFFWAFKSNLIIISSFLSPVIFLFLVINIEASQQIILN